MFFNPVFNAYSNFSLFDMSRSDSPPLTKCVPPLAKSDYGALSGAFLFFPISHPSHITHTPRTFFCLFTI